MKDGSKPSVSVDVQAICYFKDTWKYSDHQSALKTNKCNGFLFHGSKWSLLFDYVIAKFAQMCFGAANYWEMHILTWKTSQSKHWHIWYNLCGRKHETEWEETKFTNIFHNFKVILWESFVKSDYI